MTFPFSFDTPYPSQRQPVMGRMAVATSHPLAAQAGLTMLAQGGTAMDAALAAAMMLPVVEPTGNGLGSDGFCLYWDGQTLHGLNASGWSPAAWTADRFRGRDQMPGEGWDSVTVPGVVRGWATALARFGALTWQQVAAPAIATARGGFRVSPIIARQWAGRRASLDAQPGFTQMFGRPEDMDAGAIRLNPDLASTLEELAATQGESLYTGRLAEALLAASAAQGGAMTAADLADWQPVWCGDISAPVFTGQSWRLHEIPPNGQGIAALIALGLLAHTPLIEAQRDSVDSLHLQIEAMKLALADARAQVTDPAFMALSPADMLDPAFLGRRATLIDPAAAQVAAPGHIPGSDTVYVTAADAQGRMCSWIQSNFDGFGSGAVVPGTGIHLQNRGSAFSLDPGHPNAVGPRKRPFHTIIPGMLSEAGEARMSFGVMGGPIQAQAHVQMMLRTLLYGQNPQAALDAPRWRVLGGMEVAIEPGLDPTVYAGLAARGHRVVHEAPGAAFGFGGGQMIWKTPQGDYVAGSDPRKDGAAVVL